MNAKYEQYAEMLQTARQQHSQGGQRPLNGYRRMPSFNAMHRELAPLFELFDYLWLQQVQLQIPELGVVPIPRGDYLHNKMREDGRLWWDLSLNGIDRLGIAIAPKLTKNGYLEYVEWRCTLTCGGSVVTEFRTPFSEKALAWIVELIAQYEYDPPQRQLQPPQQEPTTPDQQGRQRRSIILEPNEPNEKGNPC